MSLSPNAEWVKHFTAYFRRCSKGGDFNARQDVDFVLDTAQKYYEVIAKLPERHHDQFLDWLEAEHGWVQLHDLSARVAEYRSEHVVDLQSSRKQMGAFLDWLKVVGMVALHQYDVIGNKGRVIDQFASLIQAAHETRESFRAMQNDGERKRAFWKWVHEVGGVDQDSIRLVHERYLEFKRECDEFASMRKEDRRAYMRQARHKVRTVLSGMRVKEEVDASA